jgi:uridine kinase
MGLNEFIAEGRCLDSRGIRGKADMISDLLLTFGTRSAVMVGDRRGDCQAAHANALPHVHLANGFAPGGEAVPAEAEIEDFLELLPRLRGRARMIEGALEELGVGAGPRRSLGITGRSGCGKSLLARDAVASLVSRGHDAVLVRLDDFLRPEEERRGYAELAASEHLSRAFDVEVLCEEVLEPLGRGRRVAHCRFGAEGQKIEITLAPGSILVLEGLFLLHPRLRSQLGAVLYLDLDSEACLHRVAARELPLGGQEEIERTRRYFLPAQEAFDELFDPASGADLLLSAENPLGPG